jgi:hypothetical protein
MNLNDAWRTGVCTCIGTSRWDDVQGHAVWVLDVIDPQCPHHGEER